MYKTKKDEDDEGKDDMAQNHKVTCTKYQRRKFEAP